MTDTPRSFALACLLHAIVIGAGYMILPPMFASMVQEGWNAAALQQSWAAIPLGSVPGALLATFAIRKLGAPTVITGSSSAASAAIGLRALSDGLVSFSGALAIYGFTTGILLTTLTAEVGHRVSARRAGLAQAIFFGSYAIGAAISVVIAGLFVQSLGWRAICTIVAMLGLLLAALSWRSPVVTPAVGIAIASHSTRENKLTSLRYSAAYAAYVGGYLALAGLLPYQLEQWGWAPELASASLAVTTATFLVGASLWTYVTDALGGRHVVFAVTMFMSGLSTGALAVLAKGNPNPAAWGAIAAVGFFGGGMGVFFPLLLADVRLGSLRGAPSVGHATAASYLGGAAVPFALAGLSATHPDVAIALFGLTVAAAGLLLPRAQVVSAASNDSRCDPRACAKRVGRTGVAVADREGMAADLPGQNRGT
jgi:hypothetical protein